MSRINLSRDTQRNRDWALHAMGTWPDDKLKVTPDRQVAETFGLSVSGAKQIRERELRRRGV